MKSRPKNKNAKGNNYQKKKKNFSNVPIEVQFAQKLASNEPVMRDRAVKKLKKWLTARAQNNAKFSRDEMLRLWKGLHYCYWMSDKPLVQEQLAENIASFIHCFTDSKSGDAENFISCALTTQGREWGGIDQWRMDKFMMFVRRLLRQFFVFLANKSWEQELVQRVGLIFQETVVRNEAASLGLRLHFADIFLEELAKIGGDDLDDDSIQTLVESFSKELAEGKDERLANHLEERIYHHLMRQSDPGIAHEEDEDSEDDDEVDEAEMERKLAELEEDDEVKQLLTATDPRAGKIDVMLPQLQVNYEKLSDSIFKCGSAKGVLAHRRQIMYKLTKQFKELASGMYPLAVAIPDDKDLPKVKMAKEAKKAAREAEKMWQQTQEDRKKYKQMLKLKKKGLPLPEEEDQSDDQDQMEEGEDQMEEGEDQLEEGENQMEEGDVAVVEEVKPVKEKKKKRKLETEPGSTDDNVAKKKKKKKKVETAAIVTEEPTVIAAEEKVKPKKKKKKVAKSSVEASVEPVESHKKDKKKAKNVEITIENGDQKDEPTVENTIKNDGDKKKKKNKKNKKGEEKKLFQECEWDESTSKSPTIKMTSPKNLPVPVFIKKAVSKSAGSSKKAKERAMSESEKRRKINFALSQNKCQSFLDIDQSMQESPDIPFDAGKRPKQGVLKTTKSANNTPQGADKRSLVYNTMMNGRSKAAKLLGRSRLSLGGRM